MKKLVCCANSQQTPQQLEPYFNFLDKLHTQKVNMFEVAPTELRKAFPLLDGTMSRLIAMDWFQTVANNPE